MASSRFEVLDEPFALDVDVGDYPVEPARQPPGGPIVDAHDGTVDLRTTPGEGGSFTVRIPLA